MIPNRIATPLLPLPAVTSVAASGSKLAAAVADGAGDRLKVELSNQVIVIVSLMVASSQPFPSGSAQKTTVCVPATSLLRRAWYSRQFYKWLLEEGEIKHVPEEPSEILRPENLRELLATCDGTEFEERRDQAVCASFSTPASGWPRWPGCA